MGSDDMAQDARHAQAVRFLTTVRSHVDAGEDNGGKVQISEDQKEFLRSKGMSDDAIERARHDAERPENLPLTETFMASLHLQDPNLDTMYERAKQAFDSPVQEKAPAPPIPPASYPSSPLTLYSTSPAPPRDANEVLYNYASTLMKPRYDVLIDFFRVLQSLLMLGGCLSAIGVVLFRRYVLPRISQLIDARSNLVSLQLEQYSKLFELIGNFRSNRVAKLLPPDYEPTWVDVPIPDNLPSENDENQVDEGNAKGEAVRNKVSETSPISTEKELSEPLESRETDSLVEKSGDESTELQELEEEQSQATQKKLAPIDITHPLRSALDTLHYSLRHAARAQCGERRTITASVADEVDADDDGLMDLGTAPSESSQDTELNSPIPPVAPTRAMRSLNGTLESFRNDVRARLLEEQTALSTVGNRFSAFGSGPSQQSAASRPAAEMLQIKAEIRSLKGLMLSRYVCQENSDFSRNFPSYMRSAQIAPTSHSVTSNSS
ncbi:hypothetical protein MPSI1_001222 [Malassezia psittaci]|uniref:Peroxin-14 n=1 Tax=Malassezia psittaci TaxID=1821823 RepID=A0AAF0F409_9BASI|nr:hypothetical protein MPSI1_001222 [Malassezia psittaci]